MVLEEEEDTTMTMSEFSRMIGAGAGERRCPCNFFEKKSRVESFSVFQSIFNIIESFNLLLRYFVLLENK